MVMRFPMRPNLPLYLRRFTPVLFQKMMWFSPQVTKSPSFRYWQARTLRLSDLSE